MCLNRKSLEMKNTTLFAAIIVIKLVKSEDVITPLELLTVTSTISFHDQENTNIYSSIDNEVITSTVVPKEQTTIYVDNLPTLLPANLESNVDLLENNKTANILLIETESTTTPTYSHTITKTNASATKSNKSLETFTRLIPESTSTVPAKELVHNIYSDEKYTDNYIPVFPTEQFTSISSSTSANEKSFKTLDNLNSVLDISEVKFSSSNPVFTKLNAISHLTLRASRYLPIFSTRPPLLTPNKSLYPTMSPKLTPQPLALSTYHPVRQDFLPYSPIATSLFATESKLKATQITRIHDFEDNYDLDGFDNNIEIEEQEIPHNLRITKNIDRLAKSNNYRPYIKENNGRNYAKKTFSAEYFEKIASLPTSPPASEIFAQALEWLLSRDLLRLK